MIDKLAQSNTSDLRETGTELRIAMNAPIVRAAE